MQLVPSHVTNYLRARLGHGIEVLSLTPFGAPEIPTTADADEPHALKMFGYGQPVLIRYREGNKEGQLILNTMAANAFGHELRADRAAAMVLAYDTYNELPRHVPAFDVGISLPGGRLQSLGDGEEFFILMPFVSGTPYAQELAALRDGVPLIDQDLARTAALARYLAEIHSVKHDDPALYRRRIRNLVGGGEGIMGLADSYPPDFALASPQWLESIEEACVQWRWKLRQHPERLSQVHGDFHPFNILFEKEFNFHVLDRSRGAWGEPADDVSALVINYLLFGLLRSGRWEPPFSTLWDCFWDVYLTESGDEDVLETIAPFLAWRTLVIASPLWYDIPDAVRYHLFAFAENVLRDSKFDPKQVNNYLLSTIQMMS